MTWVAWRQFRLQLLVAVGLLIALAVLVLITGAHAHQSFLQGIRCARRIDCNIDTDATGLKGILGAVLVAIPAVIGMFWGAPLVAREFETGTYRLAFTQSISRRDWLTAKMLVIGLAALVIAGCASWLISWWYAPFDAVGLNRLSPSVFAERGVVAIGYTAFAFAVGVAAGAALRRTLPAMAAALIVFAAARTAFTLWVRPWLLGSSHAVLPAGGLFSQARIPGAWVLFDGDFRDTTLSQASYERLMTRSCRLVGQFRCSTFPRLRNPFPLRNITYQPAGHFWPLQLIELGVFALGGLAIAAVAIHAFEPRVRHRSEPQTERAALRLLPMTTPDHPDIDTVPRDSG